MANIILKGTRLLKFMSDESLSNTLKVGETSLLMVSLHEFGHALGLGHSLDADSVMRPIYKGIPLSFNL